jgi:tetrapyrrole methylase family protein/MazG family protein
MFMKKPRAPHLAPPSNGTDVPLAEVPASLEGLVGIIRHLLGPQGCPWDREQTLESLRPLFLEEAYEVIDAINEGDMTHLCEELGDVLMHIVFQAELAELAMPELIGGICQKLVRRHPHVFGDVKAVDAQQVVKNWGEIKAQEKGEKRQGVLSGVPRAMPALERACKLSSKAARVGFDWPDVTGIRRKVDEEIRELEAAATQNQMEQMEHELGDLLFAIVNWGRRLKINAEQALRLANDRFEWRFGQVESRLRERHQSFEHTSLEEMDALWNEAKAKEAAQGYDKKKPQ